MHYPVCVRYRLIKFHDSFGNGSKGARCMLISCDERATLNQPAGDRRLSSESFMATLEILMSMASGESFFNSTQILTSLLLLPQHLANMGSQVETSTSDEGSDLHFAATAGNVPHFYSPEYQGIATTLHSLILFFGTLGNFLVIVVVLRRKFLQTPVNYYLVSLAVADVLVLLASIPDTIASYFRPYNVWVLGQIGCQTLIFLQYLGINASSASMLAFSLERYHAVCRPRLRDHQLGTTKIRRVIILIWACTALYCSPWFWLTETVVIGFDDEEYQFAQRCQLRLSWDQNAYLFLGDLIIFYIIPLFICSLLYTRMALVLFKSTRKRNGKDYFVPADSPTEPDQSSRRCSLDGDRARKIVRSRIQVVKMLALVVLLFAVLSVPYRCWMVYNCFASKPWLNLWYVLFAKTCIFLHSAVNPVMYNSMNTRFRMAFRSMLTCERPKR